MNTGQFVNLLRSQFLIDAKSLSKVTGQPFKISEIEDAIYSEMESI
jgi:2-oxoglutarate ferredoxin oxidoreductase subunit alpha